MRRTITGFEQDDEKHWRAILDCEHRQHVRHDRPVVHGCSRRTVVRRVSVLSWIASAATKKNSVPQRGSVWVGPKIGCRFQIQAQVRDAERVLPTR